MKLTRIESREVYPVPERIHYTIHLSKVIQNAEVDHTEFTEYLEDYEQEEDYKFKYKVEDLKDALFHAMMKKDEKLIGKYINQINVLTEKGKLTEVDNGE